MLIARYDGREGGDYNGQLKESQTNQDGGRIASGNAMHVRNPLKAAE